VIALLALDDAAFGGAMMLHPLTKPTAVVDLEMPRY